jgi:hypothetical protein
MEEAMKKGFVFCTWIVVLLLVAACGTSLNIKTNEQGDTVIEVGLPEDVVNTILRQSVDTGDADNDLLTEINSVDMKPGLITVTGTRTLANGTEAPGSFDLALGAENGDLKATVSNVQIQGYEFTEQQLTELNQRIAQNLGSSASDNDTTEFNSVNITDNSLQFVMTVKNNQ